MSKGGLSGDGLVRMHEALAGHVERGEVPGLVSLVHHRGETHVDAIGTKALDAAEPVERDSIFRIASLTKAVTAVAALLLVEEQELHLDEPIGRLLPELADRQVLRSIDSPVDDTVPAARPITVVDVLTNRLGWGTPMVPPDTYPIQQAMTRARLGQGPPNPEVVVEPGEWIRRLGELPLMHQPGARWMYHTGSDVTGVLVARASGQPFDVFVRERIFEPLGMVDTAFAVPAEKVHRLPTSYWTSPETGKIDVYDEAAGGQWSHPPAFPSGGGGLVSTVDDYLAFAQMLMHRGEHGGTQILSPSSVELMTRDHITAEQKAASPFAPGFWETNGWGCGVAVATAGTDLAPVGSYGWTGGLGTVWRNDPDRELTLLLFTQRAMESPDLPPVFGDFLAGAYAALNG
jgi:CubicO group peptidase (beta-lactamase class C family)